MRLGVDDDGGVVEPDLPDALELDQVAQQRGVDLRSGDHEVPALGHGQGEGTEDERVAPVGEDLGVGFVDLVPELLGPEGRRGDGGSPPNLPLDRARLVDRDLEPRARAAHELLEGSFGMSQSRNASSLRVCR